MVSFKVDGSAAFPIIRRGMKMQDPFKSARRRYLPDHIKTLFVAEAPPSLASRRFFYFVPVNRGDTLFLEMMKVLYPGEFVSANHARQSKEEFLNRFSDNGFYLIDACTAPLPKGTSSSKKKRIIRDNLPALKATIRKLSRRCDSSTRIILIGRPVYDVCSIGLADFNIANREMIDFPATGKQQEFRRKLRTLISEINP